MEWRDAYDEETTLVLNTVQRFCEEEVEPMWKEYEAREEYPKHLVKRMAELGLFSLAIPEEYGGFAGGTLLASLVARELSYAWPSLHLLWTANTSLATYPIIHAGNKEQKEYYLPRLARGELLGCFGLTETGSGSDAASLSLKAEKCLHSWLLNGSKLFITNALNAHMMITFARTGKAKHDISAFIVPLRFFMSSDQYPNVEVKPIKKRVMRSSDFCEVRLDHVTIPHNLLLGEENKGFPIALATLELGRINIAAQAVGIAARVVDETFRHLKIRKQFGKSLWENQKVQVDFFRWQANLLLAWEMIKETSCFKDEGRLPPGLSSKTKLFATETAWEVCHEAVRYFGAMAVTEELPWLEWALSAMTTTIYEGASNIQEIIIARELNKAEASG